MYFLNGFVDGIKTSLKMLPLGLNMLKTKCFDEKALISHKGCKGKSDIHKIIKKAREIELAKAK